MSHTTVWTGTGMEWTVKGPLSPAELMTFSEEAAGHPELSNFKYFIWDTTGVTEYVIDADDTEYTATYAAGLSIYNTKLIGAVVVTLPSIALMVEHYMVTLREKKVPWEIEIFADLESARKWIESKCYGC